MTTLDLLKKQLNDEGAITRKFIDRIPYDKLDWRPHPRSMDLGFLISHIGEIPGWFLDILTTSELNMEENPYQPEVIRSADEMWAHFEQNLESGLLALDNKYLDRLDEMWTMRDGEKIFFTVSKLDCLMQCLTQIPHHRAQLGVYLRLLDIPVPGSYGPSADELAEMMHAQ
jgi:uncharacterized damage-inducible protein DinB